MTALRHGIFGLLTAVLLVFAFTAPAEARALEAERQAGLVGDQADGYLGIVQGGDPQLAARVQAINAQRRAHYMGIAQRTGAPLDAVGALSAQTLYEETRSGEYFRDASGRWIKKP